MGWFYPPPPQPQAAVPKVPPGTTAFGNLPPTPRGSGAQFASIRSSWLAESWPAQTGADIASGFAQPSANPPFPVPFINQAQQGNIRSQWPTEQWPSQTADQEAGFATVGPQAAPSPSLTISDITTYLSWPQENWAAQTGARIAGILAIAVNPPSIFPSQPLMLRLIARLQWMPEWWYAQSECAIASGIAQLQQPPLYQPNSMVDTLSAIRSTWPQESWAAQSTDQGAGFIPPPVTALPFPIPHKEVYQWAQEMWPAQAGTRGAPSFSTTLSGVPFISISRQMAIRATWPGEDWRPQRAAPAAGIPNVVNKLSVSFTPASIVRLWPQEQWPAQRGATVAGALAAPFVPPLAPPHVQYPIQAVNAWPQEQWPTQHVVAQSGATPFSPPLPPAGFTVIDSGGRVVLSPKKVSETRLIPMDFISRLGVGETIISAVANISVYSGIDPSPSSMLVGPAGSSGSIVAQYVKGGVLGTTYELSYTVTTSAGQTLELAAYLSIAPDLM